MKNSNDTISNRTRNLPVCSAVPQPTAPPRDPYAPKRNTFKQDGARNNAVVGAFAKLQQATNSFVMYISPYGTTRLPLDGFRLNLVCGYFLNLSRILTL